MPEIDLGKVTGDQGPQGERGSQWHTGTAVTGTASAGTVMPSSGVTDAKVNDMYLNTDTSNVYICTVAGDASTAKWAYKCNIKGNIGNTGPAGPTGEVDENTPITFTEAATRANIASGEAISTLFGKIKKWFTDLKGAAFCSVVNNGATTNEGTVLDGRMGKTLTETDNDLQDQIDELNGNLGSAVLDRQTITLKSDEYYELNTDYSWYAVKNGVCYVQMQIRCKVPKTTSDNYYPLNKNLPKNALGNYLYCTLMNLVQIRIDSSGNVRVATGTVGEWGTFYIAYPVAP